MSNCIESPLFATTIVYIAFASDASGTNFSLGTPLSTSKYIGFLSLPSTASPPSASDYTGLWVALYGSEGYVESALVTDTTSTTPTVISNFVVPIGGLNIGDEVVLRYVIFTSDPSANSKTAELFFLGQSVIAPDLSLYITATHIFIDISIKKKTISIADYKCNYSYTDGTGLSLGTDISFGTLINLDDTDSAASDIHITGTCATGSETLSRVYSAGQRIR